MKLKDMVFVVAFGLSGCVSDYNFRSSDFVNDGSQFVGSGLKVLSYVPRVPSKAYGFVADGLYGLGEKVGDVDVEDRKDEKSILLDRKWRVAPLPPVE